MKEVSEASGYYGEHEEFETEHPIEEPEPVDPENACFECGEDSLGMCGCCGNPLCSRHIETQGGFCSEFKTHEFEEGEVIKVTDGWNNLNQTEVKFQETVEVSGCLMKIEEPEMKDLFFPMDKLPENADKPVSELPMNKIEIIESSDRE